MYLVDFLLLSYLMNTPTISGLTKLIFGIEPGDIFGKIQLFKSRTVKIERN